MCAESSAGFGGRTSGRGFGNRDSSVSNGSEETDCLKMTISSSDVGKVIGKVVIALLPLAILLYC